MNQQLLDQNTNCTKKFTEWLHTAWRTKMDKIEQLDAYMRELLDKYQELYLANKETEEVVDQLKIVVDELVQLEPNNRLYKDVLKMVDVISKE